MKTKQVQDYLSTLFVFRDGKSDNDFDSLCFNAAYMAPEHEAYSIYEAVSAAQRDSGLSYGFSYEIASRAVSILSELDAIYDSNAMYDAISEAVEAAVPIYTNKLMEIYKHNPAAVDEACEELCLCDGDSATRASTGWYVYIERMTRDIAQKLSRIANDEHNIA